MGNKRKHSLLPELWAERPLRLGFWAAKLRYEGISKMWTDLTFSERSLSD